MADVKSAMREVVCKALNDFIEIKGGSSVDEEKIVVQTTPNPEMGDLGVPVFVFAKTLHMAPPQISAEVVKIIKEKYSDYAKNCGEFTAVGPYVNLKLNKAEQSGAILKKIFDQGEKYGSLNETGKPFLGGRKVMIEFSAPNTNKPLHLGHLRNDALGESVSRILKAAGAEVCKVNLVNNRGVHICKSMLAYKWFHEEKGETPESLGIKGDHFVGQCYVEFDRWLKGEKDKPETAHPEALAQAEEMLVKWEAGDPEVHALWKKMNDWTISGIKETYERTGVSFDRFYFESETYLKGKDEILKGLEKGIFFKAEDGSVRIDVTDVVGKGKDEDNHEKVLLRKDGTSVYITGANMAGKSTFLRALGINYILAMNGMPVFATSLRVSAYSLFSSMRTTDDLAHGISYFNAELLRLKQLLTACQHNSQTLIILDEILKGTNSADKLNGSRLFLQAVSALPVTGVIATHDLELSKMEGERFHNYCFEIALGAKVSYSYKVTPGVAHNQNATFLLKEILETINNV